MQIKPRDCAFPHAMAPKFSALSWIAALTMGMSACNSAYADRVGPSVPAQGALAQAPMASPYQVELIGENGQPLRTYQHHGRFYVLGAEGQRYTLRLSNPTSRRIEAVLSVDGLDVIDGKGASLSKRGYVVPAHGELRVDGFRVSTEQVATFRFSSVSSSYAGRKGAARNVGVIGVAIFEEQAQPEVVMPQPMPRPRPDYWLEENEVYDDTYTRGSVAPSGGATRSAPPPRSQPAPSAESAPSVGSTSGSGGYGRPAPGAPRVSAQKSSSAAESGALRDSRSYDSETRCCDKPRERSGLGTEFGEYRRSGVSWTQFVRANARRPSATVELRYNNEDGLRALGIQLSPVDPNEIGLRETANPFPGSGFAEPPR